ncbi:MAG: WecB/TagA/CpsF family glycosyltransferase [Paracoccaceae bacterium]
MGFCGFGAGLDFVAGQQMRAPVWIRKLALEWLWRALSAPRRLIPRYASCAAILPGQVFAALKLRLECPLLVLDQPASAAQNPAEMISQHAPRLGKAADDG